MDKDQFTNLVLEAEPTLYRVSKSILKNDYDCADAVQEAILAAYTKLKSLKKQEFFKTWLCRILIRECYRILNARKRSVSFEEYAAYAQTPSPEYGGLQDALSKLGEKYRVVVILHYAEGFKTREIAGMLKIPEGTVKSRLSRAKTELKQYLNDYDEQEEINHEMGKHLRRNAASISQ